MRKIMAKLITDDMIESALQYLSTASEPTAASRAMRLRKEFSRKRIRAKLILEAPEKTAGLREAWAEAHPAYERACEEEIEAVEADEYYRSERSKADIIVEAWRSEQANQRAGSNFR